MRKVAAVSFILLFVSTLSLAQKPAELPDKPINPKAGRIVQLKEDLCLTDESGNFYLKYPQSVKVAPDGTIYLFSCFQ
jgi:hypothetical protein